MPTGYFVVNGDIVTVDGEAQALEASRPETASGEPNATYRSGVVYWTREGAQNEVNRLLGLPTLTDIGYSDAEPPLPPGVKRAV